MKRSITGLGVIVHVLRSAVYVFESSVKSLTVFAQVFEDTGARVEVVGARVEVDGKRVEFGGPFVDGDGQRVEVGGNVSRSAVELFP